MIYLIDFPSGEEKTFINDYSPKFLKIKWNDINEMPLDKLQKIVKNNFVDLIVDSDLDNTPEFNKLFKKVDGLDVRNLEFKFTKMEVGVEDINLPKATQEYTEEELIKIYLEKKAIGPTIIDKVQQYIRKEKSNLGGF